MNFIQWLVELPVKTKIVSAVVAGTVVIGSSVGIGMTVSKLNKSKHTHSYTQQITTQATCEGKGVITFTCSCNHTYTEEIPALGHDEETHEAQTPTCTEIGWTEYATCKREGCKYSTYVQTPALGHEVERHNAQSATCIEIGWEAYETCACCAYTTYAEIPATGIHVWNEGEITTQPTCTKTGIKTFACTACKKASYTQEVGKENHEYDTLKYNAEKHWHECSCGAKQGETTHAGGTATCTAPAVCATCGQRYGFNLGHNKVQHNAQPATCTEIGWNAYETCTRCDYTTYAETPALNHDKVQHNAQPATCTEIGWNAYETCSRCDYTTYAEIPALGHDIQGTGCIRCELLESTPGLKYTANDDGTYTVTGIGTCTATDIVIGFYNGKAVAGIGESAFENRGKLKSVVIGDNVTSIGARAFKDCTSLTSVVIGKNVKSIGEKAFYCCYGLENVVIPDSVTSIGNSAFSGCESLKSVTIGSGVTSIGSQAFYDCHNLISVYYKGTESDWEKITIGNDNRYLTKAMRYYSETQPTSTGKYWHYGENGEVVVWG